MKRVFFAFISCLVCLVITGCATVFTGTTQSISVKMLDEHSQTPISAVRCDIVNSVGTKYHLPSNPGSVIVNKGQGPLNVQCSKAGYHSFSGPVPQSFNVVTLLDIFLWPTFIIDYGTGAMMKYPSEFVGEMIQR